MSRLRQAILRTGFVLLLGAYIHAQGDPGFAEVESPNDNQPGVVDFGGLAFSLSSLEMGKAVRIATFAPVDGSTETLSLLVAVDDLGIEGWVKQTRRILPSGANVVDVPSRNPNRAAFLAVIPDSLIDPDSESLNTNYHLYTFEHLNDDTTEIREYTRLVPTSAVPAFEKDLDRFIPLWLRDLTRIEFPPFERLRRLQSLPFQPFEVRGIQPAEWIQTDPANPPPFRILNVDAAFLETFGANEPPAIPIRLAVPGYIDAGVSAAPVAEAFLVLGWRSDSKTTDGESLTFSPLHLDEPIADSPAALTAYARQIEERIVIPFIENVGNGTTTEQYHTRIKQFPAVVVAAEYRDAGGNDVELQTVALFDPDQPIGMLVLWTAPKEVRFGRIGGRVIHSLDFVLDRKRLQTSP